MKFNIRKLTENDWDTLVSWWEAWPKWNTPAQDFLPDNATSGLMIEKNNIPIVAGFIYTSNSSLCYLDWIISNPKYREKDRKQAIELLISEAENKMKKNGYKYILSITRNKQLLNVHEKLNWTIDNKCSHEIIKKI